jgi:hypothetical protein
MTIRAVVTSAASVERADGSVVMASTSDSGSDAVGASATVRVGGF